MTDPRRWELILTAALGSVIVFTLTGKTLSICQQRLGRGEGGVFWYNGLVGTISIGVIPVSRGLEVVVGSVSVSGGDEGILPSRSTLLHLQIPEQRLNLSRS